MKAMPQVLLHQLNQGNLQGLRFTSLHLDHTSWLVVEKTVVETVDGRFLAAVCDPE